MLFEFKKINEIKLLFNARRTKKVLNPINTACVATSVIVAASAYLQIPDRRDISGNSWDQVNPAIAI